ncbi:hypothetical protein [Methanobrevibacter sp. DSM 116169]|uniref:hypothetical protein n=1 Tax=Methanobrevibacter sp. DSM 116169 TaxID=3242727 RepID=UPI0038FCA2A7
MIGRCIIIKNYSIFEVVEIINDLNPNLIEENTVRNTKHIVDSINKRFNDINLIYELLFSNEENVGILKSNYNTFKIFYKHPIKKSKDVCIVISINDNKDIKLITSYLSPIEKRVRTYER